MDSVQTERLSANEAGLSRAAELLRSGGTVAFPTETVYGLGANALDDAAVAKIFEAKQRPRWDPLIVHVIGRSMLDRVADTRDLSVRVGRLMDAFWPGPLTLLLPRRTGLPEAVTSGRPLVGVRMPAHPVAKALLERTQLPIAAPSANRFGHVSPTSAEHVLQDLDGRIHAVLDAGRCSVGVESTVLDPSTSPVTIYRPGAVTLEMIERVAGAAVLFRSEWEGAEEPESLPSPGVGLRHYAPRARLLLVRNEAEMQAAIRDASLTERVGVLLPNGWTVQGAKAVVPWSDWEDLDALAAGLFAGLRSLDEVGLSLIVCPLPQTGGIGDALRDRLEKASRSE